MFDYLKNTIAKTVSNSLISLAGYVGGYSLVDPSDKHGVKNSHLLCKGKIICIPFYHGGHCCQVYLNFDRKNFEEVAYGVLFPDGKIIDITTGCPGLGGPQIHLESFGPECQLIWSDTLHKFPEHLDEMNEEDYYLAVDPMEEPEPSDSEFIEPSDSEESPGGTEEMHLSSSVETDDMTNFDAQGVVDPVSDPFEE
jgi:hypothetical protein